MAPVLLSRALDAALGVLTGIGAYYLHETHPRTGIQPQDRLTELLKWKWAKYWDQREEPVAVVN
ncbi:hypothetical protein B0H11DRAFT_2263044 [Mycena galericulata]|nr:hypothetical protein B0H11DRAFT_2263044 [Mycena galericulata]